MTVDEIRTTLQNVETLEQHRFEVIAAIGRLHAADPQDPTVQELILRALDHQDVFNGEKQILVSLARERGLFPYLRQDELNLADQIAYEFHKMPGLGERGIVFHGPQARIYQQLMSGASVILSAPTSFGKSLIIDAVILSGKFHQILIVVPTIALIDETRRRIVQLGTDYKIITHSSQRPADRSLFIMTQERALEYQRFEAVEFFVIDEFYKLSPSRGEDERATILNHVFYQLATAGKQFYMLGPSVQSIPAEVTSRFECTFVHEPYHTVVSELHRVEPVQDELDKVVEIARDIDGPTIVYCRSPKRAANVAKKFADRRPETDSPELLEASEWMASQFHEEWHVASALRVGVGVHHGRVPRSLSQYVVRAFDRELLDVLVCTSSLIEGVNTRAKNVIILDDRVSRDKFDFFTFNNIRGRSGRMFQHFVGHVYMFHAPPAESLPFIDVPVVTQSEDASDSLLVQLSPDDLDEQATERMKPFRDQSILPFEVLQANAGVDPEAQLAVAEAISRTPERSAYILGWTQYPEYQQLEGVCELMWTHFNGRQLGAGSALTASQLAFRINRLRQRPTIRELIDAQLTFIRSRSSSADADDAVQNVLDFLKLWPGFHFPRLLQAIDRIQQAILPTLGYRPGNYSFYGSQVEHCFLDPVVPALEEYGIPTQLGLKLSDMFANVSDLDEAIEKLQQVDVSTLALDNFERLLLEDAISSVGPASSQ